jgi:hypothetical protein
VKPAVFAELSGFLFLLIIVILLLAGQRYGYQTFSGLDSDTKLQEIGQNPRKFRIAATLVFVEHVTIVALAVSLFIAFGTYNLMLGIVWLLARSAEALVQMYNKSKYWGLLSLAEQYSKASGNQREAVASRGRGILRSKNSTFILAQILFSVGTLAYSTVFVAYELVPLIIGWFGVSAASVYGLGNCAYLVKPKFKALWNIGGLMIFIFELVLGGWLLLGSFLVT